MKALSRFEEYRDTELDVIILKIRNGTIKSGKFINIIKVDKNPKVWKELVINEDGKSK
jgi:hypothetical protein